MADEQKTILRFEGDATGAKAAAKETANALRAVGTEVGTATSAQTEAATATEKAGQAAEGYSEKGQRAARGGEAFRAMLRRLSPELAQVAELGTRGSEALGYLFTPLGTGVVAAGAALVGLKACLDDVYRSAAQLHEMNLQVAASTRQVTEEIQKQLAARGVGSEPAANLGAAKVRDLTRAGFRAETAKAVFARGVGETGEQVLSDQELAEAAALMEVKPDAFPKQGRPERVRSAIAANRKAVEAYLKAMRDAQTREQEDILRLDENAMRSRMEREGVSLTGPEGAAALQDIRDVAERGQVGRVGNPFAFGARQATAVDRARQLGLITPGQADAVRGRTAVGAAWRDFIGGINAAERMMDETFGFERSPRAASGLPSPADVDQSARANAGRGAPVVITGGTIYLNAPAAQPVRRMQGG